MRNKQIHIGLRLIALLLVALPATTLAQNISIEALLAQISVLQTQVSTLQRQLEATTQDVLQPQNPITSRRTSTVALKAPLSPSSKHIFQKTVLSILNKLLVATMGN